MWIILIALFHYGNYSLTMCFICSGRWRQRTLNNPVLVLNDIEAFGNVLSCQKHRGDCVYYSSSSESMASIRGDQNEETTPLNSGCHNAVVKNVGESYLKNLLQRVWIDYTIFRYFNTMTPSISWFVISRFLHAALNQWRNIIHGTGKQSRTFLFINVNIMPPVTVFDGRLL